MIEIKGITLPVLLIRISEGAEESVVFEQLEKLLNSKLSEGAYFLVGELPFDKESGRVFNKEECKEH